MVKIQELLVTLVYVVFFLSPILAALFVHGAEPPKDFVQIVSFIQNVKWDVTSLVAIIGLSITVLGLIVYLLGKVNSEAGYQMEEKGATYFQGFTLLAMYLLTPLLFISLVVEVLVNRDIHLTLPNAWGPLAFSPILLQILIQTVWITSKIQAHILKSTGQENEGASGTKLGTFELNSLSFVNVTLCILTLYLNINVLIKLFSVILLVYALGSISVLDGWNKINFKTLTGYPHAEVKLISKRRPSTGDLVKFEPDFVNLRTKKDITYFSKNAIEYIKIKQKKTK